MPDKSNTNPAKTPIFTPFLPNSRLKYVQYVGVRLCQKSSKIAAFWLPASLASMFLGKTRRVSALIPTYNTRAQRCISKNTVARPRFALFLSGIKSRIRLLCIAGKKDFVRRAYVAYSLCFYAYITRKKYSISLIF